MTKAVLLPLGFLLLLAAALPAQTKSAADMAVNRAVMDQANKILLRQKLEDDPTQPKHILTETGVGYRFAP